MKKLLLTIFTTILILLLPCMAWAATYTVTQTGGGADYSVAQFNALTGSKAGDTFNFSGTITSKVVPAIYGTSGNHVILDGGDIDGVHATIDRNGGADGMWITGKDYITIQDFEITDFTGDGGLVLYQGCDHVNIYNCIIHNGWHRGIFLATNNSYITIGGSAANGNHLYNCGMDDSAGSDIDVYASRDVVISYNKLHGDATHGVDGVNTMYSDRILIEYNEIYNHKQIGQTENAIDLKASTNDVIIRFNEMYGHPNPEEGTIHVSMDSDDVAIYGNRIYDGNIGILIFDGAYGWTANGTHMNNIKIWSNLIYDNEWGGIWVYLGSPAGDAINDIVIYNNIFAENGNSGTGHTGIGITTGTGHVIKNNIFYKNRPSQSDYIQAYYTGTVTSDYNQYYWPSHTSYIYSGGSNKTVGNVEANGSDGDPGLTNVNINDYTLLGTSACKDTGVDLSGLAMSITIQGTTYDMYYDDCLDDSYIDFSTTPPTVRVIKQDDYGSGWEKGAFIYSGGSVANQPPNGTITSPSSNPTVEIDDEVTLAGSGTDPDSDCSSCTYTWVIEAETYKEWDAGTTYDAGDIVEDPDAGDSGDFYKSKAGSNLNHEPPNATYWDNAETQQNPGTGVSDTAGVYSITLTVNDGTDDDPTPATRTITVNAGGGTPATEEVWSKNSGADYDIGDATYINGDEGTCSISESITGDSTDFDVSRYYDTKYLGSAIAKSGGYPATCEIKLKLKRTGNCTGKTFYISEVPLDGTALDMGSAETVNGMDATTISTSATEYTFSCSHNLTEGNVLIIWLDGDPSTSNYVTVTIDSDSEANLGDIKRYTYQYAYEGTLDYDFYIKIYETSSAYDDTNYGSNANILVQNSAGTDDKKALLSFSLSDITGETVSDAKLELYLETAPSSNINVELWSCNKAFVEAQATWNIYSTGNAWTDTTDHDKLTFLGEVAFTSGSSTGQYYSWQSDNLTSYIGSIAAAGGTAYFILYSDATDTSAISFSSDDDTDAQRPKLTISYGSESASVPEVVSVTCSTEDGEYNDGDSIGPFQVLFSEPVDVTGTPQLTLELGDNDAVVNYASGTGTSILTFAAFEVAAVSSHTSADLDATQLDLNSGSIASTDDAEPVADTADILDVFPTGATTGSLASNKDIVIDTTVPTTQSVNNTCTACTGDGTYDTVGTIIIWEIELSELSININAEPDYPRIATNIVGTGSTVYDYCLGLGDDTGRILMGHPLQIGERTLDYNHVGNLDLGPGGSITDPAGNPVAVDMGALDLSAGADIEIAVPYPSTDPLQLDATNTIAAWILGGAYPVPDDFFEAIEANSIGTVDLSGSDGTSGHPITIDGGGFADDGVQTYGDYYTIKRMIK